MIIGHVNHVAYQPYKMYKMETAATQELCGFLTGVYETNADIDKEIARVQQAIADAKNGDSQKGRLPLSKILDNYKRAKSDFDKAFNATIPKIEMDPTSFLTL